MDTLTPRKAAAAGLSPSALRRGAQHGRFEKIARGIYRDAEAAAADWDWIEAATRRSDATICLTSALAHYDLTDAIPSALDIAIRRGSRIPASESAIDWHLFDARTFGIGRETIQIPGSDINIGIYSPERCIADAFRMRGGTGYELGRDALKEWLRRGGKPGALMQLALRLPRAAGPIRPILDALT